MSLAKPNICSTDGYQVLQIDPPWPQQKGGRRRVRPLQGKKLDYPTMPVTHIFELLDLEIFPLAISPHTVFIWSIEAFLYDCEQQMTARGYRRHCRLIWNKGNGIAPCYSLRFSHEYLLWYYHGCFQPVAVETRGRFTSVFSETPREHSRKPEIAYRMIEAWYPGALRLDVFSRESRPGWHQYGNQPNYFNSIT